MELVDILLLKEDLIQNRYLYKIYKHTNYNVIMYGISVKDVVKGENYRVNSITSIESVAQSMYNIIKDNIVLPVHLGDVVYNLINEYLEV